jgi:hypothetical protein
MPDDTAYFMRRKPGIHRDGKIVQPELGFHIAATDVDMRRFAAFVGIEKGSIRSPAQNCRYPRRGIGYNGKLSCFFAGISTFLSLSIANARAIRRRVECGMMTSSM